MAAAKITLNFKRNRDTKNTVVYQNTAPDRERDSFYLQKSQAAELGNPEVITVQVSAG